MASNVPRCVLNDIEVSHSVRVDVVLWLASASYGMALAAQVVTPSPTHHHNTTPRIQSHRRHRENSSSINIVASSFSQIAGRSQIHPESRGEAGFAGRVAFSTKQQIATARQHSTSRNCQKSPQSIRIKSRNKFRKSDETFSRGSRVDVDGL